MQTENQLSDKRFCQTEACSHCTLQTSTWRQRLRQKWHQAKSLKGEPHYVARGMAIGVFVAVTPTIPLHTVIALGMAVLFKASKPAAAIGVWFSNPLTIPAFYYGSYHLGSLLLGNIALPVDQSLTIQEMLGMGADVTLAMLAGGALLGVVPAVAAYVMTFQLFRRIRMKRSHSGPASLDLKESNKAADQ